MDNASREKILKLALRVFGVIFLFVYPLGLIWPSGWVWHGGMGFYYLQMITGIYVVLGTFLIMGAQAFGDSHETSHLMGAVPALLLVAAVLWFFSPRKQ